MEIGFIINEVFLFLFLEAFKSFNVFKDLSLSFDFILSILIISTDSLNDFIFYNDSIFLLFHY